MKSHLRQKVIKLKWVLSIKNILGCTLLYKTLIDEEVKKYRISENTALALYQIMKDTHELLT